MIKSVPPSFSIDQNVVGSGDTYWPPPRRIRAEKNEIPTMHGKIYKATGTISVMFPFLWINTIKLTSYWLKDSWPYTEHWVLKHNCRETQLLRRKYSLGCFYLKRHERYLLYTISLKLQNCIQLTQNSFLTVLDWINYLASLANAAGADLPRHGGKAGA